MRDLPTLYIVKNLKNLVRKCNEYAKYSNFSESFREYDSFMRVKEKMLKNYYGNFVELLKDKVFIERLRKVLKKFGMNQRRSILTPFDTFRETLVDAANCFNALSQAKVTLETLSSDQEINGNKVNAVIQKIYDSFSLSNRLSQSGGIVIASKTMHMIMPELFTMVDSRVMKILHKIYDYHPHINDGSWYDVIPEYNGYKLNPYPLTYNWDYFIRYFATLFYYKRIILEWCSENDADIQKFIELDPESRSFPSRIIDKALWFLGR